MASLTLDQAKAVYRQAVDAGARDSEGEYWWTNVHREVQAVAAAQDLASAEEVIRWWHHDWSRVGDTARDAARRIRKAVAGQLTARRGTRTA
ncbi:MAG: hypothetical protein C0460_16825 [Methylibium sp.]|nr:hypothetical protein [Methylibium sp.]